MSSVETDVDTFLTEQEVARILRVAPGTVRNCRQRGEITFLRLGIRRGRVLYRVDDVQDFIERSRRVAVAA
jgi:excisionase family DNA binding protein